MATGFIKKFVSLPLWSNEIIEVDSLSTLHDTMQGVPTKGFMIGYLSSTISGAFVNNADYAFAAMGIFLKASGNNVYFLAFGRDYAAVGNFNMTSSTITRITSL